MEAVEAHQPPRRLTKTSRLIMQRLQLDWPSLSASIVVRPIEAILNLSSGSWNWLELHDLQGTSGPLDRLLS